MQTGQRWSGRGNPRDLTGLRGRQLLEEKRQRDAAAEAARRLQEHQEYNESPEERVARVQATLKSGTAYFNDETGQVEIDYSTGR